MQQEDESKNGGSGGAGGGGGSGSGGSGGNGSSQNPYEDDELIDMDDSYSDDEGDSPQ